MRTISIPAVLLVLTFTSADTLAASQVLTRGDQRLVIDSEFALGSDTQLTVTQWLETTSEALAAVYGRWPRDEWKVVVKAMSRASTDPVPWGQVTRGDPNVVSFYIDESASSTRLIGNWTAYHEFSHLLIPYRGWGDMWFSEGLASYYQNLLQVRSGVLNERELWQKLYEGFERGRTNKRPDLSLAELSPKMRESRSFMRVYWSGALYFLMADMQLRQRTQSGQSLDTALALLNHCCADSKLSARDIASRLDQLTGQTLFLPLFDDVASSRAIPDYQALFVELGITIENKTVQLSKTVPPNSIREGISRQTPRPAL